MDEVKIILNLITFFISTALITLLTFNSTIAMLCLASGLTLGLLINRFVD